MELKLRKYINNTSLPKYDTGKIGWGSVIGGVGSLATDVYKAFLFDDTADDYINQQNTHQKYVGDIGYEKISDLDKQKYISNARSSAGKNIWALGLSGASTGLGVGSQISPGWGSLIGTGIGLGIGIGSGFIARNHVANKASEVADIASKRIDNYNEMARSDAYTQFLQQRLALKYGDSRSLLLFHDGKSKFTDPTSVNPTNKLVHTSSGKMPGILNSWTEKGEGIWNDLTGEAHLVTEGPNDGAPSNLKQNERVFGSTINPFTGNTFKKDAAPIIAAKENLNKMRPKGMGWLGRQTLETFEKASKGLDESLTTQLNDLGEKQDMVLNLKKYKCGKPSYDKGKPNESSNVENTYGLNWWDNVIPAGINSLIGLLQLMSAWKDEPYNPHTYVPNRYANKSLATLAGLRIDPYGTILLLRDAEARTNNAITSSGGLSTAQKNLSRIASLHGTQQQIGNMLNSIQAQNNSYFQHYADTMLLHGLSEAQRLQSAKQYDLEYYSKAHAAKKNMEQMGMYNLANTAWTYASNEFKRKNAIANLKLYADNNKIEQAKLDAWLNANTPKDDSLIIIDKSNPAMVYKPEILDLAGVFKKPQLATPSIPKWTWQPPQNLWLDGINKKYGW